MVGLLSVLVAVGCSGEPKASPTDDGPATPPVPPTEAGAPSPPSSDGDAGVPPESKPPDDTGNGPSEPAGCSVDAPDVGTVTLKQTVAAGKDRTYHLSVPEGYRPGAPMPLVFVLHGAGDTNPVHMREWFDVEARLPDALYVYPQALVRTRIDGTGGNVPRWDLYGNDDLALFDTVVAELSERYCVDRSNVLATGFSSGGNFAHQLACLRQSEVRAIGAVSGPGPFTDVCGGAVAVWMTHDTGDQVLPIADAHRARDFWAHENGCGDDWEPDILPMCKRNAACPPNAPLVYCETSGIGHEMTTFAVSAISDFFGAILKTAR